MMSVVLAPIPGRNSASAASTWFLLPIGQQRFKFDQPGDRQRRRALSAIERPGLDDVIPDLPPPEVRQHMIVTQGEARAVVRFAPADRAQRPRPDVRMSDAGARPDRPQRQPLLYLPGRETRRRALDDIRRDAADAVRQSCPERQHPVRHFADHIEADCLDRVSLARDGLRAEPDRVDIDRWCRGRDHPCCRQGRELGNVRQRPEIPGAGLALGSKEIGHTC
jgi:hypothetical protein